MPTAQPVGQLSDNFSMKPILSRAFSARARSLRRVVASVFLVATTVISTGCSSLLPESTAGIQTAWATYDDARAALDRIVPYETRRSALDEAGLEPKMNPAVTILTYSDILLRFAVGSVVRPEDLDRGIRECLSSGKRCQGYSIVAKRTKRDRTGNFWLDSLGFKRETDVTGWSFNALILFVDDLVVYTVYGGQPKISEREVQRNPLGPIQSWGDQVPAIIY